MERIIDLVLARKAVIKDSKIEAARTGSLAIAAVLAGIGKPAWAAYMAHFGAVTPLNPEQLRRLNAEDGSLGDPNLDRCRAYLVSNGVCGIASPDTQGLDGTVESIDNGVGGVVCPPPPPPNP
jgi:hypothetical protein